HESGITKVADPFGGSFYIEELTDKIERGAREYLEQIDSLGGTLAAIEKGWIQAEIQNAAYEFQQQVERGEKIVVGVNRFHQENDVHLTALTIDSNVERQQVERLRAVRASRNESEVVARLGALEGAARDSDNLMPKIMSACEAL